MAAFSRTRSGGSLGGGPSRHNSGGDSTPVSQLDDEDRGSLEPFLPSVVQVFCSSAANDWSMPWSRALPVKSTGSGWIYDVDKRIIVTNAHVVEFASTLQVAAAAAACVHHPPPPLFHWSSGQERRRRREVRGASSRDCLPGADHAASPLSKHGCTRAAAHPAQVDLALLTVKKAAFWSGAAQLDLGPSPRLQQEVHVIGYPLGGEGVSITAGVVSRVDYGEYVTAHFARNTRRVTVTPLQGMRKARRATSACRLMLPSTAGTGVLVYESSSSCFVRG